MDRDKKLIPFGIIDAQKILFDSVDGAGDQPVIYSDAEVDMDHIIAFLKVSKEFFRCVDVLSRRFAWDGTFPTEDLTVGQYMIFSAIRFGEDKAL